MNIIIKRFLKTFIAGGIAGALLVAIQSPTPNDLLDGKKWLLALIFSFVTSGLMAIEKALQAVPPIQ